MSSSAAAAGVGKDEGKRSTLCALYIILDTRTLQCTER